ncbi:MAG: hypothetical protein JWO41_469 [Candidatus Saccharibacteria bacterium]|nr:hypothetical protein [Candidatus Saccharibacteria bacterium]
MDPNNQPAPTIPVNPEVTPTEDITPAPVALPPTGRRRVSVKLKTALIALGVVLLIGAGTAAAYVGVIVPNKPENALMNAVVNSLQAPQTSFKGSLDISQTSGLAGKVTFSGSADASAKAFALSLSPTVSGVTLPIEARYVGGSAYLKLDDLSQLETLAKSYSPQLGPVAKTLSTQLSGKWVEFDSTLIKEAKLDCVLNADWTISKADTDVFKDAYAKNKFATIVSSSSDTVDGKKVAKYEVSIDDDKAAAFGNTISSTPMIKKLSSCNPSTSKDVTKAVGDHDKTPLTIWVDKGSKHVVKLAAKSTSKDKKTGTEGSVAITLAYDKVTVTAPTGAVPAVQVYAQLQQAFGTSGTNPLSSLLGGSSLQ